MKNPHIVFVAALALISLAASRSLRAQDSAAKSPAPAGQNANSAPSCSGMYSFQKEGEFIQVSIEDAGQVSGFISHFGDGESYKVAFLDEFFKTGKFLFNNDTATTET